MSGPDPAEPLWLNTQMALDMHAEQLALYGGPQGVRDVSMLESALDRPRNKFAYGDTDMAALAAAYAYGIARNHPFVDGNKRAAFQTMLVFLRANSIPFRPDPAHAAAIILELAAGHVGEAGLTRWIRDNWPKV